MDLANPWSHLTRHGTVWTGHHPLRVTYPPRCQVWGKRITCTRIRGTAHAPGTASTCRFTLLSNLHTREATARGGKSRCFFTCESRLSWKDRKHTTVWQLRTTVVFSSFKWRAKFLVSSICILEISSIYQQCILAHTPVFIEALATVAKTWTHPVCPCRGEWTKTMRYRHAMEHFSAIKKSGTMPFEQHG